jgi:hypothetical protein
MYAVTTLSPPEFCRIGTDNKREELFQSPSLSRLSASILECGAGSELKQQERSVEFQSDQQADQARRF